MRILHVVPSYLPAHRYGGPIYSVHGLCKALAERNHDVHVYTTNVDGPNDSDVRLGQPVLLDGVRVCYFPSTCLRRLFWSPLMARALIQDLPSFDVVHLHSVFLWPTWMAARVSRRHRIPYVLTPRGMLVKELIRQKNRWIKSVWIQLIERRNIESASLLHLTSKEEFRALEEFSFKISRWEIIPNGIDSPAASGISPSAMVKQVLYRRPLILFLSRVHWKKGVDRIIQALPLLPEAHLVVAGNDEEGYLPLLQQLAEKQGVSQRVSFLGPVHNADKNFLLQSADVFVLPSAFPENFGNAALEALVNGCPTVVSDRVGLAEWIASTGSGKVTGIEPEALAGTIRKLLDDVVSTRKMAEHGRTLALDQFTWCSVAEAMERAYKRIETGTATLTPPRSVS